MKGGVMHRRSGWSVRIRLALAAVPAVVVFASALAQQPDAPQTQTPNMTGGGGFVNSDDLRVSRIRFEAGARTYWHIHTAPQVIVAEDGEGLYQERGSGIRTFGSGEAAYLAPNVAHWHGATPAAPVVQSTMYGGTIEWLGPVTDEEYSAARGR
jgi:quercetin dioxygenase-like cupin family protein